MAGWKSKLNEKDLIEWDGTIKAKAFIGSGITGGSYTDEEAQDAVGSILTDTATIDFTYNDVANTITADVKVDSINDTHIDWGTGANQVSTTDMPEGTNLYFTNARAVSATTNGNYGDGSDGDVTISSGTTTLTRDMLYNNLTINAGAILATAGFRVFVKNLLTLNGTIRNNGANATSATAGAAGSIGSTLGSYGGGGNGTTTTGGNSGNSNNPIGSQGGAGGSGSAGAGGSAGTATAPSAALGGLQAIRHLPNSSTFLLNDGATKYTPGTNGGGGGGDSTNSGGGGGGGGGAVGIYTKTATGSGAIEAKGGNGFTATTGNCGGGGGGGGGAIVYVSQTPLSSTSITTSVAAGTKGNGVGTGTNGSDGTAGRVIEVLC